MTDRMTGSCDRIEVITSVRRRRWPPAQKLAIVARRHGIAPNQLFDWQRLAGHGAAVLGCP